MDWLRRAATIAGATVASRLPNLALLVVALGFTSLPDAKAPEPKKTASNP